MTLKIGNMWWFLHIRHFLHQQTISHMRKHFPEWVHFQVVWILRGSTLNSLRDVRKSNSDVFPSFKAIYVWYYEKFHLQLVILATFNIKKKSILTAFKSFSLFKFVRHKGFISVLINLTSNPGLKFGENSKNLVAKLKF
jgi:hypothetical protein